MQTMPPARGRCDEIHQALARRRAARPRLFHHRAAALLLYVPARQRGTGPLLLQSQERKPFSAPHDHERGLRRAFIFDLSRIHAFSRARKEQKRGAADVLGYLRVFMYGRAHSRVFTPERNGRRRIRHRARAAPLHRLFSVRHHKRRRLRTVNIVKTSGARSFLGSRPACLFTFSSAFAAFFLVNRNHAAAMRTCEFFFFLFHKNRQTVL